MEGLLPMVYRAVKKNRTRRQYERLPSGASPLINMAEIYPRSSESHVYQFPETHNSTQKVTDFYADEKGHRHRRHQSVGDFAFGFSSSQQARAAAPKPIVRFRSQRMFSCITGV